MLVLASASSMSACIIPVAPDFQDPPTQPDSSPQLASFDPPNGMVVTVIPDTTQFGVLVSDPDPGDTIYYRWAVDYPKYTTSTWTSPVTTISPPADGQPIPQTLVQTTIDCTNINDTSTSTHRLELIVADQPFVAPDPSQANTLEQLQKKGIVAYGNWTINLTCKAPQAGTP